MTRYVTEGPTQPYGWGRAYVDYVFPTDPAAGANKAVTVGGENWFRVLHARATVSTSATVANRYVALDYINARGTTVCRNGAGVVVTASTSSLVFEWDFRRTVSEWATGTPVLVPCSPLFLEPGFSVQVTVDSIQAADTITSIVLALERWPTGPRGETVADRAEPVVAGY